jgi:hypothetical protein
MASPQRLPPVTFRPARAQRGERLFAGIVCLICGVGILVFAGRAGKGEAAVAIAGACLAALGIVFLSARRVHTTIDAEGVRTSSMFGRRSCRWSEVIDVDLDMDATDGDPIVSSVRIHRRGGGSFRLAAPSDSSRKGRHSNPEFSDQLATIRSYWQASTSPPQARLP